MSNHPGPRKSRGSRFADSTAPRCVAVAETPKARGRDVTAARNVLAGVDHHPALAGLLVLERARRNFIQPWSRSWHPRPGSLPGCAATRPRASPGGVVPTAGLCLRPRGQLHGRLEAPPATWPPGHRQAALEGALWSPSRFAESCGGAPMAIVCQHIERQQRREIGGSSPALPGRYPSPP